MTYEELIERLKQVDRSGSKVQRRKALRELLVECGACRKGIAAAMKFGSYAAAWEGITEPSLLKWWICQMLRQRGDYSQIRPMWTAMDAINRAADTLPGARRYTARYQAQHCAMLRAAFTRFGDLR